MLIRGRWLKIATLADEELIEGTLVSDPTLFIDEVLRSGAKADLVTFPQRIDAPAAEFDLPYELDNAAVIQTRDYDEWWNALPQETRKNIRRSEKRGIVVRRACLDEEFVKGIKEIYDETPMRQGKRFWHYGKSLEQIRRENGTYPTRSEFIGAYLEGELVGFMKWVYVDKRAEIIQILAKASHQDGRPMNAMISKAVKICLEKSMEYLVYANYTYGNKSNSPLAEFKKRNGFIKLEYPRYYAPLTLKGKLALRIGLHRGVLCILPPRLIEIALWIRKHALQMVIGSKAR